MRTLSVTEAARVADHWSRKTTTSANWWTNKRAVRAHNRRICGVPDPSSIGGLRRLIEQEAGRLLLRGISVGSGYGFKEVALLKLGVAQTIVGYDVASDRIARAHQLAAENSLSGRALFRCGDAFEDRGPYDLVLWCDSLHHIPDVREAVRWSRNVLARGGIFAMAEYVGPTRFEIDAESLARVNRLRASLPRRLFTDAHGRQMPVQMTLDRLQQVCRKDPSEACDSGSILPAIREFFPTATIREAGGLFYFVALNGLYGGLDMTSEEDRALLDAVLLLDELSNSPTLYAAAVATKES